MAKYLLIESRDPFDSRDCAFCYGLARDLAKAGNEVTMFLVQNGVLGARSGASPNGLSEAAAAGVSILADEFSLRERGIRSHQIREKVKPAPIDVIVDHLAEGRKAIWH
jgi:predicted peroxiredoxin